MQNPSHLARTTRARAALAGAACAAALCGLLLAGCSSGPKPFNAAAYTPFADNAKTAASKKILVGLPDNAIAVKDRQPLNLAKNFNPSEFLRKMLIAELDSRGIAAPDVGARTLPGFGAIASWLTGSNDIPADTLVLASRIVWIEGSNTPVPPGATAENAAALPDPHAKKAKVKNLDGVSRFSCDVALYDNRGQLLYAKRGLSILYNTASPDYWAAAHYAMKSLFDDPAFQQAVR